MLRLALRRRILDGPTEESPQGPAGGDPLPRRGGHRAWPSRHRARRRFPRVGREAATVRGARAAARRRARAGRDGAAGRPARGRSPGCGCSSRSRRAWRSTPIGLDAVLGPDVLDVAVTVLWVVGMTNAFNLLDNMDGLSAGVAAIAGAGLLPSSPRSTASSSSPRSPPGSPGARPASCGTTSTRPRSTWVTPASLFLGFLLAVLACGSRSDTPAGGRRCSCRCSCWACRSSTPRW